MSFPWCRVVMAVWLCSSLFSMSFAMSSPGHLTGCLVYTNGGKDIQQIHLSTLAHEVLYQGRSAIVSTNHFTKIGHDKLLFEQCDGLRTPNCLLMEFDLTKRTISTLRSGKMPTYIAETDSIFFYDRTKDDGELLLFVVRRATIDDAVKVAKAPKRITSPNGLGFFPGGPVVQISSDEVVFMGEDQGLWIYNMVNGKMGSIGIKHKSPRAWRGQTQQLIAQDWGGDKAFYSIDLKRGDIERLALPDRTYHSSLVYIKEYDMLIYSRTRFSLFYLHETSDIFAYHYKIGKKVKLLPHDNVRSGIWWSCPDLKPKQSS